MIEQDRTDVLATYERIVKLTGRMREAALEEDWDKVIALEAECAGPYAHLMATQDPGPHDAAYERRKSELIRKLLEDDAHIRERMSGQLSRIWRMIDGRGTIDRLNSAYGGDGGLSGA